jgi:hypothetical protein
LSSKKPPFIPARPSHGYDRNAFLAARRENHRDRLAVIQRKSFEAIRLGRLDFGSNKELECQVRKIKAMLVEIGESLGLVS